MWAVISGGAVLITIDLLFLSANLIKLLHGAWLPILIGLGVFAVMTTWKQGTIRISERRSRLEGPIRQFTDELNAMSPPLSRLPGTAVFMDRDPRSTPLAMRALVEHLRSLPERVVILTIETAAVPHMKIGDELRFDDLGYDDDGIAQVTASFGYMDRPKIPLLLQAIDDANELKFPVGADDATFFLSTIEVRRGLEPGMAIWRKSLFVATSHVASDAADYFGLPQDRTVILGSKVEI
jgi:KUP system potassium uptake protein